MRTREFMNGANEGGKEYLLESGCPEGRQILFIHSSLNLGPCMQSAVDKGARLKFRIPDADGTQASSQGRHSRRLGIFTTRKFPGDRPNGGRVMNGDGGRRRRAV